MKKGRLCRLGMGIGLSGIMGVSLCVFPAPAVQFGDGTIHFAGVPSLGKVSATDNQAWAWSATYFFTVKMPADASEPLGQILLKQTEGLDTIDFNTKRTYAYLNGDRRQKVALQSIQNQDDTLTVQFDPPIAPGTTVTLGLRPYNNPRNGGVYLFGVTAYPAGEKVSSQFIGYGRLQFYENSFFNHSWGWP
ncbi:MAG: DUF2808 domain-containing protein [Thermosynechococcaceae cyanobacterium]